MRIAVVGSGPAGIAATTTLLSAGCEVTLFEAGNTRPSDCADLATDLLRQINRNGKPDRRTFQKLRHGDIIPSAFTRLRLAGENLFAPKESRVRKRILGSLFTYEGADRLAPTKNAHPPRAIALGGLSNVWGAACYGMSETDFEDWPIDVDEIAHHYRQALEFLNVNQTQDSLTSVYPLFDHSSPVEKRNCGSVVEALMEKWKHHTSEISDAGIQVGRSRLAVDFGPETGCVHCGYCLSGCPADAIFNSTGKLNTLRSSSQLTVVAEACILRFEEADSGKMRLVALRSKSSDVETYDGYDNVVLAAGTLSSFRLAAQSLGMDKAQANVLDNDVIVVPMFSRQKAVRKTKSHHFALSEAAMNIILDSKPRDSLHGQFYSMHPFFFGELGDWICTLPRFAEKAAYALTSRFTLAFLYLPGSLSRKAHVAFEAAGTDEPWEMIFEVKDNLESMTVFKRAIEKIRSCLFLNLTPLAFAAKSTPFGFSGHLAGTMPMSNSANECRGSANRITTDRNGRLHRAPKVVVVDGSIFPSLPAQNLTLTIVANAIRVTQALVKKV
jgi:choline dehydrogenase-like flavoprotein